MTVGCRALHSGSRFSRIAAKNSSSIACSFGGTFNGNISWLMRVSTRCRCVCHILSLSHVMLPCGPSMRQSPFQLVCEPTAQPMHTCVAIRPSSNANTRVRERPALSVPLNHFVLEVINSEALTHLHVDKSSGVRRKAQPISIRVRVAGTS